MSEPRRSRSRKGGFLALPLALAGLALLPAGAGAATICVAVAGPGCEATAPGVQAALDAAKATSADDRVVIGAGRFDGPFDYVPVASAGTLLIVGQGDETVLSGPSGPTGTTILELGLDTAGNRADVADLSVHLPANTTALNPGNIGIRAAGTVERVKVVHDANDFPGNVPTGVVLATAGAVLRDSVVEMPADGFVTGVVVPSALGAVREVADSRIRAAIGVSASGGAIVVTRSRIVSDRIGLEACNGPVTIESSLIRVTGTGKGLEVQGDNRCGVSQSSIAARHLTIVGSGVGSGQVGAEVRNGVAGQNPTLDLSLSIVRDVQTAFRTTTAAVGVATTRVGASDFEAARRTEISGGGGTAVFEQPQPNIDADPLFANPLGGGFALLPGSPAIDSAFSPPLGAGESPTDLAGNPRILDGNGDGIAARDMGAFEAPAVPVPPVSVPPDSSPPQTRIDRAPKRRVKAGKGGRRAVSFAFSSSEAGSSFQCRLDKAAFAPCRSPFKARLKVGAHTLRVRAIDAAGNVDPTPATVTVRVVRKKKAGSGKAGKKRPSRSRSASL